MDKPPIDCLAAILRDQRLAHFVQSAETIRNFSDSSARNDAAHRMIREMMLQHAVSKISLEERNVILEILAFALPLPKQIKEDEEKPS